MSGNGICSARLRILASICFLLGATMGALAFHFPYFPGDVTLARSIQSWTAIHQLMWFVSWLGADWVPYLYVSATGLTFHLMGRHRWAVVIWIGVGGSALLNRLLKVAIARQRPNGSLVEILIEYPNESFPSGHVVLFITYFGFLAYLAGRSGLAGPLRSIIVIVSAMLILLVGPSRVYVGAHWPSDILGGYLFGSGWLAVMVLLDRRLRRPSPG